MKHISAIIELIAEYVIDLAYYIIIVTAAVTHITFITNGST